MFLPSFTPGGARLVVFLASTDLAERRFSEPWPPPWSNWVYFAPSVRKRPHPQFLLANLPQAGKACRLGNKEEYDQGTCNHERQMFNRCGVQRQTKLGRHETQNNRQDVDQRRPEKGAQQAPEASNNDHEQDTEALIDREHGRLRAPVPEENQQRTCNTAVE